MQRKTSASILTAYSALVIACAVGAYLGLPHSRAYYRLPDHVRNAEPLRLRVVAVGKDGRHYAVRADGSQPQQRYAVSPPTSTRLPNPGELHLGSIFIGRALKGSKQKVVTAIAIERDRQAIVLAAVCFLLLGAVCGVQGVRTAVAVILAMSLVVFVLLPLSLRGWNPLLVVAPLSVLLIAVTLPLISGWNRKTALAVLSSICAVVVAAALAFWCCRWLHFIGLNVEFGPNFELETQYWYNRSLRLVQFNYLLVASMILSSLGVVMDISITVCSAVAELKHKAPELGRRALAAAGTRVGHDVMCMMAITLAFVSIAGKLGHFVMLTQRGEWRVWVHAVDFEDMSAEIVRLVVCSLAMLVAMTLAAVLSGLYLGSTESGQEAEA